jgi:hypothetical protein
VHNEDEAEPARQAKRRADAKLEARLRTLGLLDPDDDIVEAVCAPRAILIAYEADPAAECKVSALERGCCCCFSSRRVYFPHAKVIIGLERVWQVESWGTDLSVVFSAGEELTAICLLADGIATVEQVTDFADRLLAQRDRQVAELPEDAQRQFGSWSADLERRGVLDAALAELVPQPRTRVGAWLRALLLGDPELMARHRRGTGWSGEETPVLQAAFVLQVRRFFGGSHDASAVPAFMSSLASRLKEKGKRLDLARTEALIRSAVGESAPDFDDILPGQRHQLACLVAGFVVHELQMTPRAIWLLVIRSEQMAFAQGWNPPPPEN